MDSAEREVTTERLQDLLQTITRHFSSNQAAMRKTETLLLDFITLFAHREVQQNERDRRRERMEKARRRGMRKQRPKS
jgi:hemerythrin